VTSSVAVFEAVTVVNSKYMMIENQKKKIKYGYQRNFYINLHSTDSLGMEFTAC